MKDLVKHAVSQVVVGKPAPFGRGLGALTRVLAATAALTLSLGVFSSPAKAAASQPYVVGNDRGGFVRDRLIELRNLRASGRRVEIRGNICYSTCTMLLGLPNTCISPNTKFGFHGPSKSGQRLSPAKFDFYSRVIAEHYPQKLNAWYMETGRNRINGVYKIRGSELIRMGVKAC